MPLLGTFPQSCRSVACATPRDVVLVSGDACPCISTSSPRVAYGRYHRRHRSEHPKSVWRLGTVVQVKSVAFRTGTATFACKTEGGSAHGKYAETSGILMRSCRATRDNGPPLPYSCWAPRAGFVLETRPSTELALFWRRGSAFEVQFSVMRARVSSESGSVRIGEPLDLIVRRGAWRPSLRRQSRLLAVALPQCLSIALAGRPAQTDSWDAARRREVAHLKDQQTAIAMSGPCLGHSQRKLPCRLLRLRIRYRHCEN